MFPFYRNHFLIVSFAVVLIVFILAFQNCSVYQSAGKKSCDDNCQRLIDEEKQTIASDSNSQKPQNISKQTPDCEPYLFKTQVQTILNTSDIDMHLDSFNNDFLCSIVIPEPSITGLHFIQCSIYSRMTFQSIYQKQLENIDPLSIEVFNKNCINNLWVIKNESYFRSLSIIEDTETTLFYICEMEIESEQPHPSELKSSYQQISKLVKLMYNVKNSRL